jgi:hypothetical protein
MVSRAQIERLRQRVEALVPPPRLPDTAAREKFAAKIECIAARLAAFAEQRGEPWPPVIRHTELSRLRERLNETRAMRAHS